MPAVASDTPPPHPPGTVITFYSFKGGVGRSMALANVAVLLARAGKRVLCLDWDLEAPGLDRYFRAVSRTKPSNAPHIAASAKAGGLLALFEGSAPATLAPWREYVYKRLVVDVSLDFIGSGDDAADYSGRLASFSWAEFFAHREGGLIIEALRNEWKAAYDYILVDSRTGLTDASGICTIQMPDLLVLLFAANEQNTHWCERVARSIRAGRRALPYERTFLPIIPLLARFDAREESDRAAEAKDRIAPLFASYFSDWLPASISARTMLDWSLLPYVPRYSFEEALAVEEEPSAGAQGLSFYYDLLARLILARFQGVRDILAGVGVPGAAFPPLLPGSTDLRRELRNDPQAVARYTAGIKARVVEDPMESVEAFDTLARVCASVSRPLEAEQSLKAAMEILRDPSVGHREEIPRMLGRQAEVLADSGRTAEAEERHREAIIEAIETCGEHDAVTAHAREAFASFLEAESRRAEAAEQFSLAVRAYDHSPTSDPAVLRTVLEHWRDVLFELGRYPEAISIARRVLDLVQTASDRDPLEEAWALDRYGTALQWGGQPNESIDPLRKALAIEEAQPDSQKSGRVGRALNNLALSLHETGRYLEAEPLFRRALAILEEALGREHPDVATDCNNLALVLREMGRYAEAEPLNRQALAIREKAFGPEHPVVATDCGNLAMVLHDTGQYAEAEGLARRALAIWEKALGPEHPNLAFGCVILAGTLRATGRYAEAELLHQRAFAIFEKTLGLEHPRVASHFRNLTSVLRELGRYAEAEALARRALAIDEKALGAEHPRVGINLAHLARTLSEAGNLAEAGEVWPLALARLQRGYGSAHDRVGYARWRFAEHLERTGRLDEAREEIAQAVQILTCALGSHHPDPPMAAAVAARLEALNR